ncbi:MAG: thioredoxin family protein [Dehalococcoidia bacterium]
MASETSVVTPERFSTGLDSYDAWIEAIPERPDRFQTHYDEYEPNSDDIAAVKKLVDEHGVKVLTIGEHWCPDVWRGLPVMAKVAEASGMEHRIFFRDQNKDIMSEFLKDGEFESIPTMVFYDKDHNYLGHWMERPAVANDQMAEIRQRVMPDGPPPEGPERDEVMKQYRAETNKLAGEWRHQSLRDWRAMLEEKLG